MIKTIVINIIRLYEEVAFIRCFFIEEFIFTSFIIY